MARSNNTNAAKCPCGGGRRIYHLRGALLLLSVTSSLPHSVRAFLRPIPTPHVVASRVPRRQRRGQSFSTNAVSLRRTFVLDGGELQSFLLHTSNKGVAPPTTSAGRDDEGRVGCLTFVAGTTVVVDDDDDDGGDDGSSTRPRRIVGVMKDEKFDSDDYYDSIPLDDDVRVYEHTLAHVPDGVSYDDAISTAYAALVGIHCASPRVVEVGGGRTDDDVFYSGKAVVLGGNDYACFLADGLATMGIDVSLVSTSGVKTKNKQVKVMQPAIGSGDDEVGFASAIGRFDSLIDTLSNERRGTMITTDEESAGGSSTLQLLRSKHQCHKYVSTLTHAQQIIKNDGVLFGPGKANSYVKRMESISSDECQNLVPSPGFGPATLQVLLDNNVLFATKGTKSTTAVRGWELKDFWEETSWPRDSSGTGVRYGLPVPEEEDLDESFRLEQLQLQRRRTRVGSEGGMDDEEVQVQSTADDRNPYVAQIVGVEGLAERIISKRRSCVVFVAMRSCRTCKSIDAMFTRIARERDGGELMFAKADATGAVGKTLGKQLGIVAVPSFVLFRNGIRYGAVSTSKLPSDRLDKAIRDLEAGRDFDTSLEEEEDG